MIVAHTLQLILTLGIGDAYRCPLMIRVFSGNGSRDTNSSVCNILIAKVIIISKVMPVADSSVGRVHRLDKLI